MSRLIDADVFMENIVSIADLRTISTKTIGEVLDKTPTVDAVPVRHGRWIKKRYWSEGVGMGESYGYWYACSECNHEVKSGYGGCSDRFCSNCGADMREDSERHD